MFVELKCKSNFSFLRGASHVKDYIVRAQELGFSAIGVADVNGVYALPRAFEAIRDHAPNLKLISGAEITLENHPPITLIAQTRKAYGLLCRIITQVHAGKEKGAGFITFAELLYLMEAFAGGGELTCLAELTQATNLGVLREIFPGNLYLPLCRYLDGLDPERTKFVLDAASAFALPIIATNDVHYHLPQQRYLQDCLTCIREGVTLDTAGFHLFGNEERYLKSDLMMRSLFFDLPQAIENTEIIAEKCTFSLSELKYTYPHEFIPPGHTAKSYLEELVLKGAHETYRGLIPRQVDEQIRRELRFFAKRGDEHYFLTVQDIVRFAREKNILCQGRGSAANSIVCYVLGITSVDPVEMKLLFDRFMNDGRKEPPDIDIDFEHERREEVIQYIYQRFGRERAAMVAAVRTYRTKSAFLELSKAVGVDVGTRSAGEVLRDFDILAKNLPHRKGFVEKLSGQLKTFPRHIATHSGGFILSNDPLVEIVPIEPARMPGRTIIQWDKDDLETLALMKVDVLSIGFLTALHRSADLAGIGWRDIPADDAATYAMIRRAETEGTFQIESRAQKNMLVQTLPQNYYDLVIEVALVRPSPTKGGMVQPFLKGRAQALKGVPFKIGNAALESILGRTCGVPIFQEQVMQISIDVGGFTPTEADQLRRSLGKQRTADSVDQMGKKLYDALIRNGVPAKFADDLFHYIQGYAHYGFPESHAASYASLAYKSAYMKCHYPAELLCGLINSQPMGFYSIDTLINEAKRNAVQVLPIDPNESVWDATIAAPRTVRMGFRNVAQIRKADVLKMIEVRKQKHFATLEDFIYRTEFTQDVLENLAMSNVFQIFGLDRRHTFWRSLEFSTLCRDRVAAVEQLSLFGALTDVQNLDENEVESKDLFCAMSPLEEIAIDYRKTGYSLSGHLMKGLRLEMPYLPPITSAQIKKLPKNRSVRFAGVLTVLQRPPPANGTAFITIEDENGSTDLVLKSETFERLEAVIRSSRFFIIEGTVQRKGLGVSILVSGIEAFSLNDSARPIGPHASPRSIGRLEWSS